MARFSIISKDGTEIRYEGKPRYIGTYLRPSYLEFSEISSPTPIDWEVGDFVDYPRTGMRYRLYSVPQASKNAKRGSRGNSFTYSNVQLHSATKELEIALFRDWVDRDNNIHFSTSPDVVTFENVEGIIRRIQACMDDFYPGKWEIRLASFDAEADAEVMAKISEAKDFALSGGTCLDALSKIYDLWDGIGWFHSYENGKEVITVGYANTRNVDNTTESYLYGKGNGLTAIKKSQTNKDEFVTRLYVYGSERNLPVRYYNGLDILNSESVDIRNLMLPLDSWGKTDGKPDAHKAYLENVEAVAKYGVIPKVHYFDSVEAGADIYPSIENVTVGEIRKALANTGNTQYSPSTSVYPNDKEAIDEIRTAINPQDNGIIVDGNNQYKVALVEYIETSFKAVVAPSIVDMEFPLLSNYLYHQTTIPATFYRGEVVVDPSVEWRIPDADFNSVTAVLTACDVEGIDGSYVNSKFTYDATKSADGTEWIIKPTKFNLTYDSHYGDGFPLFLYVTISAIRSDDKQKNVGINFLGGEIFLGANQILDKTFHITLKQLGFDINLQAALEGGKTISMKNGACEGRDFIIDSCYYSSEGDFWALDLKRQKDKTLGMLFPNSSYPISEGDKFVLVGMAMPEVYIHAKSEKLLAEGQKLLERASKIQNHYEPSIDAKVMIESGRTLREGMFMQITDEDVVDNTTDHIIIDTLSIYEDESAIPTYKVTLRERRKVTYKGTPSATTTTERSSVDEDENGEGGQVEIVLDRQMSDVSENAVQNKVIKEYVDMHPRYKKITEVGDPDYDFGLSELQASFKSLLNRVNELETLYGRLVSFHTEDVLKDLACTYTSTSWGKMQKTGGNVVGATAYAWNGIEGKMVVTTPELWRLERATMTIDITFATDTTIYKTNHEVVGNMMSYEYPFYASQANKTYEATDLFSFLNNYIFTCTGSKVYGDVVIKLKDDNNRVIYHSGSLIINLE